MKGTALTFCKSYSGCGCVLRVDPENLLKAIYTGNYKSGENVGKSRVFVVVLDQWKYFVSLDRLPSAYLSFQGSDYLA